MIALADVQAKVVELIQAHSVWEGETVLLDDGKKEPNEEAALKDKGHCAMVMPLLQGETIDQGGKATADLVEVELSVRISINPKKATKTIYELLVAAKEAVTQFAPVIHPQDRFRLGKRAFVIIPEEDAGLMSYLLFFTKKCVF